MARKSFPTSKRAAIWQAHGRRCIYCTELIAFADLDIDHIVPAHLRSTPQELESLREEYGIGASFDVDGMENLVPSHRRCNLQKLGHVLPKNRALHFLSIAESRYKKARDIELEIKAQEERDRLTILLQVALDEGRISREELRAHLAADAALHDKFEILTALPIGDTELKGFLRSTDVDLLYERPLLPGPYGLDCLTMAKEGAKNLGRETLLPSTEEVIKVYTCQQWVEAFLDGYYASTTLDLKVESLFREIYALIAAIAQAKAPRYSFITELRASVANFDLLPLSLLPGISDDGPKELQRLESRGLRIGDLIGQKKVRIVSSSPLELTLLYNGMGLQLTEILRADLNDDGIEDVLVGAYEWAVEGSYGAGYARALTRLAADQPFTLAENVKLTPERG